MVSKLRQMTWRQYLVGLLDAALNSAASSAVVLFVDPSDFNFGAGFGKLATVFGAGAVVGALMWLKNRRLPGVEG